MGWKLTPIMPHMTRTVGALALALATMATGTAPSAQTPDIGVIAAIKQEGLGDCFTRRGTFEGTFYELRVVGTLSANILVAPPPFILTRSASTGGRPGPPGFHGDVPFRAHALRRCTRAHRSHAHE